MKNKCYIRHVPYLRNSIAYDHDHGTLSTFGTLFIGPLQQFFFNKQLFFKFINKSQTEIPRCAPPPSHVFDFISIGVKFSSLCIYQQQRNKRYKFTLTLLVVLGDGEQISLKLDGLSWKFSYMLWNYKLEKEVLWWSDCLCLLDYINI